MSNSAGCVVIRMRLTSCILSSTYASSISLLKAAATAGQELAVFVELFERLLQR